VSVIAPENFRSQRVAERLDCVPGETVMLFDTSAAVLWEHPR
jgi:RimJ/RimL family protein N-acetyltransferase